MSAVPYYAAGQPQSFAAATQQFNAFHIEAFGMRTGSWDVGLCGCLRHIIPNCCMTTCLPFVSLAQIAQRTGIARYCHALVATMALYILQTALAAIAVVVIAQAVQCIIEEATEDNFSSTTYGDFYRSDVRFDNAIDTYFSATIGVLAGMLASLCAAVYLLLVCQMRLKVRTRFQIPGGCLEDCCVVYWCSCCAIAQMATHCKSYTPGSCSVRAPDTIPAYEI